MTAVIGLEAVSRTFPGAEGVVTALDAVSARFFQGQFSVIQGPSGCGKSTFLNLVGLLDLPSQGDLHLIGQSIHGRSADGLARLRRAHIGFLFQDAGMIERMSVCDNVVTPLLYRGFKPLEARTRARKAIEDVGLGHRTRARSDTLSGGEKQRAGMARILAFQPELIVCDEPTASLDEQNSLNIVAFLKQAAANGACVICASHDPTVLARADRRIDMSRGRILSDDGSDG